MTIHSRSLQSTEPMVVRINLQNSSHPMATVTIAEFHGHTTAIWNFPSDFPRVKSMGRLAGKVTIHSTKCPSKGSSHLLCISPLHTFSTQPQPSQSLLPWPSIHAPCMLSSSACQASLLATCQLPVSFPTDFDFGRQQEVVRRSLLNDLQTLLNDSNGDLFLTALLGDIHSRLNFSLFNQRLPLFI